MLRIDPNKPRQFNWTQTKLSQTSMIISILSTLSLIPRVRYPEITTCELERIRLEDGGTGHGTIGIYLKGRSPLVSFCCKPSPKLVASYSQQETSAFSFLDFYGDSTSLDQVLSYSMCVCVCVCVCVCKSFMLTPCRNDIQPTTTMCAFLYTSLGYSNVFPMRPATPSDPPSPKHIVNAIDYSFMFQPLQLNLISTASRLDLGTTRG
jgi:hypothetical protein